MRGVSNHQTIVRPELNVAMIRGCFILPGFAEVGEESFVLKIRIETMGVVRKIEFDTFGGRRALWGSRESCFFLRKTVVGEGVKKIEQVGDFFIG